MSAATSADPRRFQRDYLAREEEEDNTSSCPAAEM